MNATGGLCGIASATRRLLPDASVFLCFRQAVVKLQVVASDIVVLTWPAFFFRVFCMQLALCWLPLADFGLPWDSLWIPLALILGVQLWT